MRSLILTAALAGSLLAELAAATAGGDLSLRYWATDLSGEVQVVDGTLGTTIDLGGDLALDGDEFPELRLILRPSRRTSLRLSWLAAEYAGDEVLSRTVEFAGQTFTLSTRVVSLLQFDYGRVGFAWQFLSSADGRIRLGPLVEVKAFRGEASLAAPDLPFALSASETFEGAFASAGAALDLETGSRVRVFAEATVLVEQDEADATDFEAGVHVLLTDWLALTGGYRSFEVDARESDDRFDFQIDGAFLGLTVTF